MTNTPRPSDLERIALIRGERELATLEIMLDCLADELSDIAIARISGCLQSVRAAIGARRRAFGMEWGEHIFAVRSAA